MEPSKTKKGVLPKSHMVEEVVYFINAPGIGDMAQKNITVNNTQK